MRNVRWVLIISGVVGLLGAASMLLVTLVEFGHNTTAMHVADRFPSWAEWSAAPPAPVTMLIVGSLCALLLVAGKWPIKMFAALAVAWFVYAQTAFGSGSHWSQQMMQTFDSTPFYVGGLVDVIALLAVSALALVIATRPAGAAQSLLGDAAEAPLTEPSRAPLS
jgi:hypothetical protein